MSGINASSGVTPISSGSVSTANSETVGLQDGRSVIAWSNATQTWLTVLAADGTVSASYLLGTVASGRTVYAMDVTVQTDGTVAVAWYERNIGFDGALVVRTFEPSTATLSTAQSIATSPLTLGDAMRDGLAIVPDDTDGFVLFAGVSAIVAYRFDGTGVPVGSEMTVVPEASDLLRTDPNVARLADGRFVVTYEDNVLGGVAALILNADLTTSVASFKLTSPVTSQFNPAVAALSDGRFVAVWTEASGGASGNDIRARIFTADGQPQGDAFLATVGTNGSQNSAAVAALSDGGFVVGWYDPTSGGFRIREFSSSGAPESGDVTVLSGAVQIGATPDIAELADGRILVTWYSAVSGQEGVRAQVWDPREAAGPETMPGGPGDDTYLVDDAGDVVLEAPNSGIDTVLTALSAYSLASAANVENITGTSSLGQSLTGNALDNIIAGAGGDDVLNGAAGNDTLHGNGGNDVLIGGAGQDSMDGGAGDDTMTGGAGNDTYRVDSAGDVVAEGPGGGLDTIRTGLSAFSLADAPHVENLVGTAVTGQALGGNGLANQIAGGAGNDTVRGGGGNDTLLGQAGNDSLDGGGGGDDSMVGGAGDDTYRVDAAGDIVEEIDGEGTDLVLASVGWTLGTGLERLTLLGGADLAGSGNGLDNLIIGNGGANLLSGGEGGGDTLRGGAGNDTLVGGIGPDSLQGGDGADVIRYGSAAEGGDLVQGFATGLDAIEVSALGFGGSLSDGMDLGAAGGFVANKSGLATASAGTGQFVWETDARILWWDADGAGGVDAVQVARFSAGTTLAAADIVVVA